MNAKKRWKNQIRGWFPQEPRPSNATRTFQVSIKSSKVLRFSIVLGVLALIISLTVVYLPFIQQQTYGFATLLIIAIANIVAAYLVHKGVLPRPTNRERMQNLAILAIVMIVVAVVWLLIGGF